MKSMTQLYGELESRNDFRIISKTFDGGMGHFTRGSCKGMSVIWSYAGGWEHVSIDGKNRIPTWDEMCQMRDLIIDCFAGGGAGDPPYISLIWFCSAVSICRCWIPIYFWVTVEEECCRSWRTSSML